MYRPEGWKNPYIEQITEEDCFEGERLQGLYERGADDMLEGLKRDNRVPNEVYADFLRWGMARGVDAQWPPAREPATYMGQRGYLVFIPEEDNAI